MDKKAIKDRIIKEIKEALKQFGNYTYYDKGASEVMDMDALITELEKFEIKDIRWILEEVSKYKDGEQFVSDALNDLQDLEDEQWDALMESKILEKLF